MSKKTLRGPKRGQNNGQNLKKTYQTRHDVPNKDKQIDEVTVSEREPLFA